MAAAHRSCRERSTPWLRPEPLTPPHCVKAGGGAQAGPNVLMLRAYFGLREYATNSSGRYGCNVGSGASSRTLS